MLKAQPFPFRKLSCESPAEISEAESKFGRDFPVTEKPIKRTGLSMPPVNKSGTAEVYLSSLIDEMKGFLFFLFIIFIRGDFNEQSGNDF